MKKLSIVILAIITMVMFTVPAMAEEGFVQAKSGCYEFKTDGNSMLVNTAVNLMLEKATRAIKPADVEKMCNDIGKSLHGKLMKHPEVAMVVVADRQINIVKYPYPKQWPEFQPSIIEILDSVLCKK